jgi:hypothetical protein
MYAYERAKLTQACQRTSCGRCGQGLELVNFCAEEGISEQRTSKSVVDDIGARGEDATRKVEVYAHIWSICNHVQFW